MCAECVNRKSKWKYPAWWPRRAWPWAWPGSGGAEGVGDPLCPAGVLAGAAQAPPSHRLCLCARPSARMLDPARGLTVRASVSPCIDKEVQGPWGLNDPCGVLTGAPGREELLTKGRAGTREGLALGREYRLLSGGTLYGNASDGSPWGPLPATESSSLYPLWHLL